MPLNIGESLAVNELLNFVLTDSGRNQEALKAAQLLADRASRALATGWNPESVAEAWERRKREAEAEEEVTRG